MVKYKLVYQQIPFENSPSLELIKEDSSYLYFKPLKSFVGDCIHRLTKQTFNVWMIYEGKEGYSFKYVRAMYLAVLDSNNKAIKLLRREDVNKTRILRKN